MSTFYDDNGVPRPTSHSVCASKNWWRHATPYIVHMCVHSKGDDVMPCPTSSNRTFGPRAIMASETLFRLNICVFQGLWCQATPNVVRLYVQPNGNDGMPRTTSTDCVCFLWDNLAFLARHNQIMCVVQERWWLSTPEIVLSCVLFKGDDRMPDPTSSICVCSQSLIMVWHVHSRLTVRAI